MCYDRGQTMIGIADVALPNLAYITEEIQGAGIAGSIDSPVVGHFQSLVTTVNWRSLFEANIPYIAPRTYHFDFRGSVQMYDQNSGALVSRAVAAVMRVMPKSLNLGTLNTAQQMGTAGEFEISYLKLSVERKEILEIDKFSFKCRIAGVDYLAKVRQDLGLA